MNLNEKIDFSKISNADTMMDNQSAIDYFSSKESKVNEISSTTKKEYVPEKFDKYERKFSFVQPEKVKLPSRGIPYANCEDEDVRNGYIWMYPMTLKEEEILSTPKYIADGTATIMALNNCIKSDISATDLIISDYYYLLLYLRKLSISDRFSFNIECPECGAKFNHDIEISKLEFDDTVEYEEPIRVDLPVSNYTVLLCIPRIKNIRELSYMISSTEKEIGISEFLFTRTLAIISSDGDEVPKEDWIVFFNNLPHEDSSVLLDNTKSDNGLSNMTKPAVCPVCGKTVEGSSIDLNTDALFRFQ